MAITSEYVFVSRIEGNDRWVWGAQRIADEPEEWITLTVDDKKSDAIIRAREKWPDLPLHVEDVCSECGGLGRDDDDEDCGECSGEGVVCDELEPEHAE